MAVNQRFNVYLSHKYREYKMSGSFSNVYNSALISSFLKLTETNRSATVRESSTCQRALLIGGNYFYT